MNDTLTKSGKRKLYRRPFARYFAAHGRQPRRATARRHLKTYVRLHLRFREEQSGEPVTI